MEANDKSQAGGLAARTKRSSALCAVILAYNEERQLAKCLAAIPAQIPVVVVDSQSQDRTVEIANELGAMVFQRPWTGFADQRNFALQECKIDARWVLFIDADERYASTFFDWAFETVRADPQVDCYDVPSALYLDEKLLRNAPGYPIFHPRLIRREVVVFRQNHSGHGEAVAPCRTARAPLGYNHYFHSGDLTPWLVKHVHLAAQEASAKVAPGTRRGKLARLFPHGLARAIVRFLYHYILRAGFRDGSAGYRYSLMYAWYELTIYLIKMSK